MVLVGKFLVMVVKVVMIVTVVMIVMIVMGVMGVAGVRDGILILMFGRFQVTQTDTPARLI